MFPTSLNRAINHSGLKASFSPRNACLATVSDSGDCVFKRLLNEFVKIFSDCGL